MESSPSFIDMRIGARAETFGPEGMVDFLSFGHVPSAQLALALPLQLEVDVVSQEKPGCRENNGVVISDTSRSIYLFGGYNGQSWLNDLWKFDIESKRWTCIQASSDPVRLTDDAAAGDPIEQAAGNQVKGKAPSRRFGYVSVVHEGKFVLFGGFGTSEAVPRRCKCLIDGLPRLVRRFIVSLKLSWSIKTSPELL